MIILVQAQKYVNEAARSCKSLQEAAIYFILFYFILLQASAQCSNLFYCSTYFILHVRPA